jgi:hypothetical protein
METEAATTTSRSSALQQTEKTNAGIQSGTKEAVPVSMREVNIFRDTRRQPWLVSRAARAA